MDLRFSAMSDLAHHGTLMIKRLALNALSFTPPETQIRKSLMSSLSAFTLAGTLAFVVSSPWAALAEAASASGTAPFLQKVVERQQMEIVLARLAIMNAADDQVKAFGVRMIQDHQKASHDVQLLAFKDDIRLVTQLGEQGMAQKAELSRLIGKEFDQAYISTMLRNHAETIQEFEQESLTEQDQEVRQWAAGAGPRLKDHLERAKTLASSLGIDPVQAR
jgi:putative membrane protein